MINVRAISCFQVILGCRVRTDLVLSVEESYIDG